MPTRMLMVVSNDPFGDQRVLRIAGTLHEAGADIRVVGRKTPRFPKRPGVSFPIRRLNLWFNKGFLFYANLNVRLFFLLLFSKTDVIISNDLDTLWPSWWISRLRKKPLVYDTHEYFTEMAELAERPRVQRFWKRIENRIFPKLRNVYTVNESIAELYSKEYGVEVKVVRNIADVPKIQHLSKAELGLPDDRFILIIQGAGINIGRGGEEAVQMMQYLKDALLLVIGTGTALTQMKQLSASLNLNDKVRFIDPLPYAELLQYTRCADLGLSLDMPVNLNYKFSLPNKLFDFIHCQTPVLSVDLPEIRKVVDAYGCGLLVPDNNPEHLAEIVEALRSNKGRIHEMQLGCAKAAETLSWQNEKQRVKDIYAKWL
jgi:glycosyltransferase involved in cell wall biosynthesis